MLHALVLLWAWSTAGLSVMLVAVVLCQSVSRRLLRRPRVVALPYDGTATGVEARPVAV